MTKLNEIAKIHSGIRNTQFKNKEKNYEYYMISLTNENNFKINKNNMESLFTDKKLDDKFLLKKGDIIMKLTPPHVSQVMDFDSNNITISSNYAIIKVNEKYSPEILNFYLNSEYIKKQIYQLSEQTSIKVITISNIKNFNIINLEKYQDEDYIELITTFQEKRRLMEEKINLEENILEELFFGE